MTSPPSFRRPSQTNDCLSRRVQPRRLGTPTRQGAGSTKLIAAILAAVLIAGGIWFAIKNRDSADNGDRKQTANDPGTVDGGLLTLTRSAIASTENLDSALAAQQWQQVLEQRAGDASAARNHALARLLVVDELSGVVTNPATDAEVIKSTRAKLPAAIQDARSAIETHTKLSNDQLMGTWMESRIDLHEADLIPAFSKSIRRDVIKKLSTIIESPDGSKPGAMRIGGVLIDTLDQMADPIDGLPREIAATATPTLARLSDAHPDNLYFAIRAARLGIDSQSAGSTDHVKRTGKLVQAIMPSLARDTRAIGKTPDELVTSIVEAINEGQWDQAAGSMALWFNVLNGTELVKTDRKRAGPHPLDLLSLRGLRELSTSMIEQMPVKRGSETLTFETENLANGSFQNLVAIDADLDLQSDLAAIDQDQQVHLWMRRDQTWQSRPPLKLDGEFNRLIAADLFIVDSSYRLRADRGADTEAMTASRHNTLLHLIATGKSGVRLIQIDGRDTAENALTQIDAKTGLESITDVIAATVGDLEADGDLDLIISTESGIRLFANRGNRTFFEIEIDDSLMKADPPTAFAIGDLDRDLDLDLVTLHGGTGKVGRLENLLHLQFRCEYIDRIDATKDATTIAIEDFDGDVAWDILVSGSADTQIALGRTETVGTWDVDELVKSKNVSNIKFISDLDNDSFFDAVISGDASQDGNPQTVSLGPWGTSTPKKIEIDSADRFIPTGPFIAAEWSGDAATDLAFIDDQGIKIATNQTKNVGHHLDVRFKGIDDNASGRVNHFAIGSVVEARFGPHYRARIITSPSTRFGIDGFESADVRAILPNGLTQTRRDVAADQTIEEEQTLKGSCPYLYAFDGEQMRFVTDCLWAAPLGLQVTRDTVVPDRPWEFLKIDGSIIKPRRDGPDNEDHYDFRITEELWEIAYFDQVELVAIDHPANVEIWTNEKVGPDFIATPTTFAFDTDARHAIKSACDTDGDDVTVSLRTADRQYVQGFDRRLRQGLCPPHHVEVDFGNQLSANEDDRIYLVMTGWILPTDTSLNIQIDQNPDLPGVQPPSVWVPDSNAETGWRNAIPFMGFPGGKTKTIVVDVTDATNRDDWRFRVATSAQIYWDSAELVIQREAASFVRQPMELTGAEVHRHGFSKAISSPQSPDRYDYHDATADEKWPPLAGPRTRLGNCIDLLRDWDDEMVVIASGDEIRLRFDPPAKPLPDGWKRDFILHNVGWDKDADLNTLEGQSTLPLPYRNMTAYPPPPNQAETSRARFEKNRSHLNRTLPMRTFWKR